jgi:dTDP-4-dehydrorhamnose reductase
MSKLKILLLGSAGMAGHIIKKELLKISDKFEIVDIARNSNYTRPTYEIDLRNFKSIETLITNHDFDYIINCSGILNKIAEDNPDEAILINSYLPHYLEKITQLKKAKIIQISTDCVFSGSKGNYLENDLKDGVGYYAQTKALGELINNKDLTIRTSIIGPDLNTNGIGLFNWFIKQTGSIDGYCNAYWSGVTTLQLAKSIIKLILEKNSISGVIHLTNNNKISKYDLLRIIKNIFELKNIHITKSDKYKIDKSLINTRNELILDIPSYEEMILEMNKSIINN